MGTKHEITMVTGLGRAARASMSRRRMAAAALALVGVATLAISGGATAQDWEHRHWREHDRRVVAVHVDHWRDGHWYHGRHAGRAGWWWVVGGVYYEYPAPVYPYPDPYAPPPPVVYAPAPAMVTRASPGTVVAAPASPPYVAPDGQTCREYQSTAIIDGARRLTYGTACLQPDGAWRIVG